jgi:hypothetical protein
MNERSQQALDVYTKYRFTEQLEWYRNRIQEFEAARQQVITIGGVLLFLASASGFLAASNVTGLRPLWAVLAAVFSAFSAAIVAYSTLMGYEHISKLYGDAVTALDRLRAEAPDPSQLPAGPKAHPAIKAFVADVEAVFRKEAGQWGQLAASPQPHQPTHSATKDSPDLAPDA